jgi:hypothetical protein
VKHFRNASQQKLSQYLLISPCKSCCIFNTRHVFVENECTYETTSGCRTAVGLLNIS